MYVGSKRVKLSEISINNYSVCGRDNTFQRKNKKLPNVGAISAALSKLFFLQIFIKKAMC